MACTADPRDPFASSGGSVGQGTEGEPGTSGAADEENSADGPSAEGGSSDDDGGPLLDVAAQDTEGADDGGEESGCTSVDLLFVIDNSVSMNDYQHALSLAFPDFVDTLVTALPEGTNVHVGVTSTEMGFSSSGQTNVNNGACMFIGDDNQPNTSYYVTPDDTDTMRNGAQGRLYDPGGGQYYADFDTDAPAAELQAAKDWFASAANIGTGGSNIEMSAAPVAWVADSANAASNDGFLRDEGAVLVVFFMQDEPDQTPMQIDGMSGGQFVLERIAAAKAGCGGTDCIVGGGFLAEQACAADGNLPLDDFLAGVTANAVAPLPPEDLAEDNPQDAADEMNDHLSTTLADVIAETCDEIEPEG
jgi:hypothetical protein